MAWDLRVDSATGDLAAGYVNGQDEIIQRVTTRMLRHLGEWFVNTTAGLPWYKGPSSITEGELTPTTAILGSRSLIAANNWIRNEIAETDGVVRVVNFASRFNADTRTYSLQAEIVTDFGLPFIFNMSGRLGGINLRTALETREVGI